MFLPGAPRGFPSHGVSHSCGCTYTVYNDNSDGWAKCSEHKGPEVWPAPPRPEMPQGFHSAHLVRASLPEPAEPSAPKEIHRIDGYALAMRVAVGALLGLGAIGLSAVFIIPGDQPVGAILFGGLFGLGLGATLLDKFLTHTWTN